MAQEPSTDVYRLHVWIRQISPMIWRRLLVRSDSTIADLHDTLQIAFGWSDEHLNLFHVHGQNYGVYHDGGMSFATDPKQIRLCDFKFRINERFLYEYDFGDGRQHEVRVEGRLALGERRTYLCCIGGQRRAPPEDCGGPLAFMARHDEVPLQVEDLREEIRDDLATNDLQAIRDRVENIEDLRKWLTVDRLDRRAVNHRLKQYAINKGACREDPIADGDSN
ncbi:MAG: plasmid pRiA4b ORF-3 family protein [Acidiferrobacterales bacterium]